MRRIEMTNVHLFDATMNEFEAEVNMANMVVGNPPTFKVLTSGTAAYRCESTDLSQTYTIFLHFGD